MRILQCFKLYAPDRGGIVSAIQMLSEGLREHADVQVLTASKRGIGRTELHNGVPVVRVTTFAELLALPIAPTYPFRFWQLSRHADVIAVHHPYPLVDVAVSAYIPKHCGLVVHWHSEIVTQRRTKRLVDPFIRRTLSRADRIIVATPFHVSRSEYLRDFESKCTVVPFGIDPDEFAVTTADARAEVDRVRSECGDFVLTVGRLVPYKGIDVLIKALKVFPGKLVIVGDGPSRGSLEALARHEGVRERVIFKGDLLSHALRAHLHACRFFVLPSTASSETFGIVQLEAMACGKAIVNTDAHPGIGWVAGHGKEAVTVRHGDAQVLAEAMTRLWEDPQHAEELGQHGARRVSEHFHVRSFLDRTWDVYRQASAARGTRSI